MSIIAIVAGISCLLNVASAQTTILGTCIGGLSPSFEIPQVKLAASGTAVFKFSPGPEDPSLSPDNQMYLVNFQMNQTGLEDILQAHIHRGNASTASGRVVIEFTKAFNPAIFSHGSVVGSMETTSSVAKAILASPGEHYINIHTLANQAGAIRAQLGIIDVNPTACLGIQNGTRNSSLGLITGLVCAGIVIAIILALLLFCCIRRRNKQKEIPLRPLTLAGYRGVEEYSLQDLRNYTNKFSDTNLLGQGGFGIVYKGVTKDGHEVAVKRAKPNSKVDSFEFEVDAISRMAHANLIRLLGYCIEEGEEILVYEYAAKGSLQDHLHPNSGTTIKHMPLTFEQRLNIALGAAQGLSYLHNFAKPTTVHRDVKPANILLDADLNAKLADFGLLKSNQGLATYMTTDVKGTAGYLDPEYFRANKVTTKSDVFGFGVVLLELLTGKEAIVFLNEESVHIRDWASEALRQIDIYEVVDPGMGHATFDELESFFEIAFSCVKHKSKNRPEMQEVAGRLRELQQLVIARMTRNAP